MILSRSTALVLRTSEMRRDEEGMLDDEDDGWMRRGWDGRWRGWAADEIGKCPNTCGVRVRHMAYPHLRMREKLPSTCIVWKCTPATTYISRGYALPSSALWFDIEHNNGDIEKVAKMRINNEISCVSSRILMQLRYVLEINSADGIW